MAQRPLLIEVGTTLQGQEGGLGLKRGMIAGMAQELEHWTYDQKVKGSESSNWVLNSKRSVHLGTRLRHICLRTVTLLVLVALTA